MNEFVYVVICKESGNVLYAGNSYSMGSSSLVDTAKCEIWLHGEKIGEISGQHNTQQNWDKFR